MTKVLKYIELPGVWGSDEEALEHISQGAGPTNWQAICDIRHRDSNGAVLELDNSLGDLYFDDELQVYLFTVEKTQHETVIEERTLEDEYGYPKYDQDGEEQVETLEVSVETQYEQLRAVSFLPEGEEDAQ